MKKLALKLDDLAVETFATKETNGRGGTVHARAQTVDCGNETMYVSCNLTACPMDCTGYGGTECCSGLSNCCSQAATWAWCC